MAKSTTAAIVLAAGKGTRMKSHLPKVLHPIAGRPMIGQVLASLAPLGAAPVVVVVGPGMETVSAAVAPHPSAIQAEQLGTGHAVLAAKEALGKALGGQMGGGQAGGGKAPGDILILYGDTPFITTATFERLLARRRAADRPAAVVLGMRPADPGEYGRLIADGEGRLEAIVEHRDATAAEREIGLCNSGVMAVDGTLLWELLAEVGNGNAKGEYYLTDIVALARRRGLVCAAVEAPAEELIGINSRAELAVAEALLQGRLRDRAMAEGATLVDPSSVWFSFDTRLGRDVTVGPHVIFGPGVEVADAVEIRSFSHIEGARIESGAVIGPFARLRPGSVIGAKARVGNFVETKNVTLAAGAKANHLSYLGDARVGAGANVGAGTITCNYDGFGKYETVIGAGAFIGSNSALVAPVTVGERAVVAAGSVITQDVAPDALAVARARQVEKPGWASLFRAKMQKLKQSRS
ncbi:MAG TPA: bifunctional UDP-N-acetylglucosamine diphosphorylase/glucosamine-1-phosphate N-acetyltransferase GlmU [Verrucomicrobiae bacterium]|nr:bifunctional UDP-N-acetylglucosamine diphosphorylase/glucosamine-1-phosphate N-acetyltransferase GlmU [Verrucomicrobiae bacterium]